MWQMYTRLIGRAFDKKIDATGFGVFRIAYSAVLLCEICQLHFFRHLIFDKIPYVLPGEVDFGYGLIAWGIVVLFLMVGWYARTAAIINYLFTLTFLGTIGSYEYHMFYAYLGANALLVFLPVGRSLSIDRLREKLRYSTTQTDYIPHRTTTALSYTMPIFVAAALVYADSILFKLTSFTWMRGMGMWLPANLPMATHLDTSIYMNFKWVALGGGYLTIIFEAVFIFLMWFRPFRIPLLVIGVGLHIGILIEFPIPWFALGVMSLYLLMVPIHWWPKLRLQFKAPKIRFLYDGECPICLRTRLILAHFDCFKAIQFQSVQSQKETESLLKDYSETELLNDVFGIDNKGQISKGLDTYIKAFGAMGYLMPLSLLLRLPGVYQLTAKVYSVVAQNRTTERCTDEVCAIQAPPQPPHSPQLFKNLTLRDIQVQLVSIGIVAAIVMQLAVSYHSPLTQRWIRQLGIHQTSVGKVLHRKTWQLKKYTREMFGITNHGVFMDGHFKGYRHVVAVTYKEKNGTETFLPIIDENGMPGAYLLGFNWVKWTFRVNSPRVKPHLLETGVRDFTAFWARKNGVSLKNAVFQIKVKKLEPPRWRENYLRDQMKRPWQDGGYVRWKNKKFYSAIKNIEKI